MADLKQPTDKLQTYLDAISSYEREYKKWESRVEKILKRYKDDSRNTGDRTAKFNILWSNVQTLVPACFSRLPQPDVSRRFKDNDPIGRVAALILERALEFEVQHYPDYRTTMKQSVYDRFLGGRGTSWARYEPKFKEADSQITEDTQEAQVEEQLDYECAPTDYVHWKDFGHSVARTWEEVTLVWRKVYMSKKAVTERFGEEIAKKIPYDATPEDLKSSQKNAESTIKKQALIYELWDKEEKRAYWLSKSMKDFVDERDDPLGLQEFFPCPRPLYATITNESLLPVPDFTIYQDQAKELDTLSDRIDGLSYMLQVKGVYDGSADASIARLFTEGTNGTLLPVKNWAGFAEKQGLKGQLDVLDLAMVSTALEAAYTAMEQIKNQVYEITGISDIVRGQSEGPAKTATEQQIKGQYASLRLKAMQEDVARYATDILQLKAQIICGKFNPQTIAAMAAVDQLTPEDQQVIPQALALLVGEERMMDPEAQGPNPLRSFRIDIAADTLIQIDEQTEKQERMEMLTAFGGALKAGAEVGAMAPPMIPLILEVLKFGIQAFKVGKSIEGTFDSALDQLKQLAQQPQGVPPEVQEQIQKVQEEQMKKDEELKKREAEAFQKETQHQVERIQFDADKQVYEAQKKADQKMMQGEQKMAQDRMGMDQEHSGRMMELDGREQEMNLRETATKAAGDLEGKLATAEERVSTADVIRKEQESRSGEVKGALTEVSEALQAVKQVLQDLVKVSRADRVAVRGPDGRVAGSKVAG